MHTNYTFDNETTDITTLPISKHDTRELCNSAFADIATSLDDSTIHKLMTYIKIWNHTEQLGSVLISETGDIRTFIEVNFFY